MANKLITDLDAAAAVGSSVVPVSAANGSATNKVTLAAIAALGGGTPADYTITTEKLVAGAVTYEKLQDLSATDRVLGRASTGAGPVEEIPCTVFGRSLLAASSASAAKTVLSLATVATSGSYADLTNKPDPLLRTGGTVTGNVTVNGTVAGVGARASFSANSEQYAVGAKYSSAGGSVYFGATSAAANPDAAISNSGGTTLMLLQNGGNVGIGTATPTQKLDVNGNITATKSLAPFDVSARSYVREWIELPNYTGLLSPNNNAQFRPNDGAYGGWKFSGVRSGWAGIEFSESSTSLMQALDGNTSGFHRNGYGWQFNWTNGTLQCFKNAFGGGTAAVVLDSVNYSSYITASTKTLAVFTPRDNQPPQVNFATLDTRPAGTNSSLLVLEFDAAAFEAAEFIGVINSNLSLATGVVVRIWWVSATATSGNVSWQALLERTANKDLDTDYLSVAPQTGVVFNSGTGTAPAINGVETVTSIAITNVGALVAGDRFRLRIARLATDAVNDTMAGDAQLIAVELRVA